MKRSCALRATWSYRARGFSPTTRRCTRPRERGLIVNQHHAIPLGVNVARWPRDVPYNFSTHPEILERAWTNAVATYKPDEEILWSVGLRGLSDSSYASLDPSVRDNDPLLGQRISEAIADADENCARKVSQSAIRHRPLAGRRATGAGRLPEDPAGGDACVGRYGLRRYAGRGQGCSRSGHATSTSP